MVHLAILWHQHQPYYKNPDGKFELPWVRLHSTKDYYDMVKILEEFPAAKVTINLVPSLLIQIDDYIHGATDRWLEVSLKEPSDYTLDDRIFILKNFFHINWEKNVFTNKRYYELLNKRGYSVNEEELYRIHKSFEDSELLDIVVLFNLAWTGAISKEKEPLKYLVEKKENYTYDDLKILIQEHKKIISEIIPQHKGMYENKRIELTTSAMYHPILPLLIDSKSALEAMPGAKIPEFSFEIDAITQIKDGLKTFERFFGFKPQGFWPSEGSVSQKTAELLEEEGIRWFATDEGILFKSMNAKKEDAFYPYYAGMGNIAVFFRNSMLSDAIGFQYQNWNEENAVDDFINRILDLTKNLENPLVSVILDGENCWESYRNNGINFLRKLYGKLSTHKNIKMTTFSEYLENFKPKNTIQKLFAGSWINSNFSIWIGQEEDKLAWELLKKTRQFLFSKSDTPRFFDALKYLYIAEGSDWFWWYGDEFYSLEADVFDRLFRENLIKIYKILNEIPPAELQAPIKGRFKPKKTYTEPFDFIKPKLDGIVTSYFEWNMAGRCPVTKTSSTMHTSESYMKEIFFGFDESAIFLRIDLEKKPSEYENLELEVKFVKPAGNLRVELKNGIITSFAHRFEGEGTPQIAVDKIIEISIPFLLIKSLPDEFIEFFITIYVNGFEVEKYPPSPIRIQHPGKEFFLKTWQA